MQYHTSLSHTSNDGTDYIREKPLIDLSLHHGFISTLWYLWFGKMPSPREERLFGAMLTLAIDHGPGTSSAQTARISASAKNDLHVTLAAGILGMGERHGCAISSAMVFFSLNRSRTDIDTVITDYAHDGKRIPGFGHSVLAVDERALALFSLAQEEGVFGPACAFAQRISEVLSQQKGMSIPLNIDGAIAAVLCDMHIDPLYGNAVFLVARTPGLVAQSIEEQQSGAPLRRVAHNDIVYTNKNT